MMPIGDCWATGSWADGAWATGTWADSGDPPAPPDADAARQHKRRVTAALLLFRRMGRVP